MEDKREKFRRLAEKRTQTALNEIRKIGNLSNRRAYDFDEGDVKKIVKALREATNDIEKKFGSISKEEEKEFKL